MENSIKFKFMSGHTGSVMHFKVHIDTKFEQVIKTYCKRQGIEDSAEYRFMFDGQPISGNEKPSTIGLEDEDIIDVFKRQIGG